MLTRLLLLAIGCSFLFSLPAQAAETSLYIVDVGPNRGAPWQVLRVDEDGSNPSVFIDQELNRPQDILFIEERGVAIVSNLPTGRITEYDADTGAYLRDFATGIGEPTRMAFGPGGLIYVLQWRGNGRVLRYERDGTFHDEFTQVGVSNAIGMDWDAEGNLYVASFNGGSVRQFDPQGNDLGIFASATLFGPTNLWINGDGELWVLDWSGGAVRRYDGAGNLLGSPVLGLSEPEGLEFPGNGHFLLGNGGTSSVKEYDGQGNFVRDLVPPQSGGLAKPNGLRLRTVSDFTFNAGLNDAWFNPATPGQGVFITVFPDLGKVFLAMFTFDANPPGESTGESMGATLGNAGHRWFTAIGDFDGDAATLDVTLTRGGRFDDGGTPVVNETGYGTLQLLAAGCNEILLDYDFPGPGLTGRIVLERVVTDNQPLCEALAGQ